MARLDTRTTTRMIYRPARTVKLQGSCSLGQLLGRSVQSAEALRAQLGVFECPACRHTCAELPVLRFCSLEERDRRAGHHGAGNDHRGWQTRWHVTRQIIVRGADRRTRARYPRRHRDRRRHGHHGGPRVARLWRGEIRWPEGSLSVVLGADRPKRLLVRHGVLGSAGGRNRVLAGRRVLSSYLCERPLGRNRRAGRGQSSV